MKTFQYPSAAAQKRLDAIVKRGLAFKAKDTQAVKKILADVYRKKDKALIRYINRFDAPKLTVKSLKVTKKELDQAERRVDKGFMRSLNKAARQIKAFHKHQVEKSWSVTSADGTMLGQLVRPVNTAGVYVPGGRGGETPLVSSVLMGCIPARVAGVKNICITTPPTKSGKVNPYVLAAARKAGVDTIFKAGSAWGIAALAYGTETVPKADVIVGPGNVFVTLAKKMVAGTVGVDMVAGPSEILVIADEKANPDYIAADLLSQAEHDPMASAVLVTTSAQLAKAVVMAIKSQLMDLPRKEIAQAALKTYGAVMVVPSRAQCFDLANQIAPEHLELHLDRPDRYLGRIQNAGAVFLGPYSPEPVGDYIAGPNHVLPTAGTARFASALSVNHFVKKTSVIHYSKKALKRDAPDIIRLAEIEGLTAHARAVSVRKN
ncbi:MAG: histidinol dehydrogenase [Deltaproteobacteria bacterium]|nr:histidinol dehydrogenase [Deltaproteobacteria bacterium]